MRNLRARVALGLGGNVGEVETALRRALAQLAGSIDDLRVASLYRSCAVSPLPGQPDFLNTAAVGTSRLPADALLALGKALELAAGRRRGPRFGPRPLDVDLLLYGDLRSDRPELTLPHPRLAERAFVLAPLAELVPELRVPPAGLPVAELLSRLAASPAGGPAAVAGPAVERLAWSRPPHS